MEIIMGNEFMIRKLDKEIDKEVLISNDNLKKIENEYAADFERITDDRDKKRKEEIKRFEKVTKKIYAEIEKLENS